MQTYPLFAQNVYKFKVDPNRYDKNDIVNKMVRNYDKSPQRNYWDEESILHHTYQDDYNSNFEFVDGREGLIPVYGEIFNKLINELDLQGFVNFSFHLQNVAINTQYMKKHIHLTEGNQNVIFSTVHYVKFNKNLHPNTTFINPIYKNVPYKPILKNSTKNSFYFEEWEFDVEEDDMLIFPASLEHYVKSKTEIKLDCPRIVISTNIRIN